jgi:hypothetical protein
MGSLRMLLRERLCTELPPDTELAEIDRCFVEAALKQKGYYVMEFNGLSTRFIPRLCRYAWSRNYRIVMPRMYDSTIVVSVYRG